MGLVQQCHGCWQHWCDTKAALNPTLQNYHQHGNGFPTPEVWRSHQEVLMFFLGSI